MIFVFGFGVNTPYTYRLFVPSAVIHRDGHHAISSLSKVKVSDGLYLMLHSFTNQLVAQPDMSKCRNQSTASKNDVNFLPIQLNEEVIYGLPQASVVRVLL